MAPCPNIREMIILTLLRHFPLGLCLNPFCITFHHPLALLVIGIWQSKTTRNRGYTRFKTVCNKWDTGEYCNDICITCETVRKTSLLTRNFLQFWRNRHMRGGQKASLLRADSSSWCRRDVTRSKVGNGLPRGPQPVSHTARHRQRRWRRAPALRGENHRVQRSFLHWLLSWPHTAGC